MLTRATSSLSEFSHFKSYLLLLFAHYQTISSDSFFYQLELPLSLSEFPHLEPYLSLHIHLFTITSHLSSNFTHARTLSSPIFLS